MKDQSLASTSDKKLFLSDVHLGGFVDSVNDRLEQELINLIDYCEDQEFEMYILGDLFDYWMEYPDHKPLLGERLLQRFERKHNKTGSTLYITGNHDNWTNGYFSSLGFDIEKNHRFLQLDRDKVMMMHGDGLDDSSYNLQRPLFHRLLRNSNFVKLYQKLLPPKAGLHIMKTFSRIARMRENSETEKNLNKWAEIELKRSDTDVIICGHDHVPRMLEFDFGTLINLGTFYQHRTVAVYNNNEFSIVIWDDATRQLTPITRNE